MPNLLSDHKLEELFAYLKIDLTADEQTIYKSKLLAAQTDTNPGLQSDFVKFNQQYIDAYTQKHYQRQWLAWREKHSENDTELQAVIALTRDRFADLSPTALAKKQKIARQSYLYKAYKNHMQQIEAKNSDALEQRQSLMLEHLAKENGFTRQSENGETVGDTTALLRAEKLRFQQQVNALAKLHIVIERVEGRPGSKQVSLKRWARALTDVQNKKTVDLYKKLGIGYTYQERLTIEKERIGVAGAMMSALSLAFTIAAFGCQLSPALVSSGQAIKALNIASVSSTNIHHGADVGVGLITGLVNIFKGESSVGFAQMGLSAVLLAATANVVASELGCHYLKYCGGVPVIGMAGLALSIMSIATINVQRKISKAKLLAVQNTLDKYNCYLKHYNQFENFLNEGFDQTDTLPLSMEKIDQWRTDIKEQHHTMLAPFSDKLASNEEKLAKLNADMAALPEQPEYQRARENIALQIDSIRAQQQSLAEMKTNLLDQRLSNLEVLDKYQAWANCPEDEKTEKKQALDVARQRARAMNERVLTKIKAEQGLLKSVVSEEQIYLHQVNSSQIAVTTSAVISVGLMTGFAVSASVATAGILPATLLVISACLTAVNIAGIFTAKHSAAKLQKKQQAANVLWHKFETDKITKTDQLESVVGIDMDKKFEIAGESISLRRYIEQQIAKHPEKASIIIKSLRGLINDPNPETMNEFKSAMSLSQNPMDLLHQPKGKRLFQKMEQAFNLNQYQHSVALHC